MGDHTETVQLDFNPEEISYAQLLDIFWNSHCPDVKVCSRQYASILFYHDDMQKAVAESFMQQQASALGKKIFTELTPFSGFHLAEDYHQKYYLQHIRELFSEFGKYYKTIPELTDSTAAARVNGYLKGAGTPGELLEEIDSFGLSDKGRKRLIQVVESY